MKKLVFATTIALTGISLVSTRALRAQDSGQNIQIQDPAEFNAYQNASTQTDPAQKCAALESFYKAYPQSVAKKTVLDQMIDCYQTSNNSDGALSAAKRLLQVDPNNMKAIFISVYLEKQQCGKSLDATGTASDTQTCDDSGAIAQRGLTAPKPADMQSGPWQQMTSQTYPMFHSAIAFDDAVSKKDFQGAIDEYTKELMLYAPGDCAKPGPCLADTLQLAQAYAKPGASRDEVKAIWFYARAWDFAPPAFKTQIDPQLDYWYKRYHGTLDPPDAIKQQEDAIKAKAQATLFPPADGSYVIAPAPSPADLANKACAVGSDELKKLNLEDKEFILANGSKECTDRLWGVMKDQPTPVPGVVIADSATELKVSAVTAASAKPKDFIVKLTTPGPCSSVPPAPGELKIKDAQAYILANGVKADTDAMGDVLTVTPAHLHKLSIEPSVTAINVAVTQDAKDSHTADFTVNMKGPLSCKEAPASGAALGLQSAGAAELDGTYDTYTQTPASGATAASAQIVLRDGSQLQEQKKGPVHHAPAKPPAAHHAQ
jgi:hypothetical protein